MSDVIDTLVGITPGSALDAIRARRPEARTHAQASYRALFAPTEPSGIAADERFAIACFTIGLHDEGETFRFYEQALEPPMQASVEAAVAEARTTGPYGSYPPGPLSAEDTTGPVWQASPETAALLGPRLAAAFAHVHMLVYRPRDAAAEHLAALLAAGWSTTEIVTLSQIVSFLAFQIRVVAGLRLLARAS